MNYINGTSELIIILTKLIAFSGFSALIGCISNKHHNNVKGNPTAIFSSITVLSKRSVRLLSILKNGHLTSANFLISGNSTL